MRNAVGSWLDARPSVRLAWLIGRNVLRRWPLVGPVALGALAALAMLGRVQAVARAIGSAAREPRLVLVISALIATVLVARRHLRLARVAHRRWLGALPNDVPAMVRAASGPVALGLAAAVWLALASTLARLPAWMPARIILVAAAGAVIGVALAAAIAAAREWRARRGRCAARVRRRSRYSPSEPARSGWATRAMLAPLGGWPLAEARFRDRPSIRAHSLWLLLLAVPMNEPVGHVLASVFVWLLILHLLNLLRALVRAAFPASWWLAPTSLGPVRFAIAFCRRSLGATAAACAVLIVLTYALGGATPARISALAAALWLAVAGGLGVALSALALRARSKAERAVFRWRG